jgi:hypothetical protein
VTNAVFKLILNTLKTNMEERNLMAFLKTHTSSSFWKKTVPRSHFVDLNHEH